mmetsp:Transcript_10626/g.15561  ORF Transcript_10626/g.15561 Transcript_10626/m.15561 type:complete len:232 (+) Transcript_10626:303-998(+)
MSTLQTLEEKVLREIVFNEDKKKKISRHIEKVYQHFREHSIEEYKASNKFEDLYKNYELKTTLEKIESGIRSVIKDLTVLYGELVKRFKENQFKINDIHELMNETKSFDDDPNREANEKIIKKLEEKMAALENNIHNYLSVKYKVGKNHSRIWMRNVIEELPQPLESLRATLPEHEWIQSLVKFKIDKNKLEDHQHIVEQWRKTKNTFQLYMMLMYSQSYFKALVTLIPLT